MINYSKRHSISKISSVRYIFAIKMAKINKINAAQKMILANFIEEHLKFGNKKVGNEGATVKTTFWKVLTKSLNDAGPPVKDTKIWRKVYSDRKYLAKKKLLLNKLSNEKFEATTNKDSSIILNDIKETHKLPKVNKLTDFAYVDVKNNDEDDLNDSSIDENNTSSIDWPSDLDENINSAISAASKEKIKDDLKSRSKNIENQNKFLQNIEKKLDKLIDVQIERLNIAKELLKIENKRLFYKKIKIKLCKSKKKKT